jgi:pteridine reductase
MSDAPLAIVTGGKRRLGAAIAARLAHAGYALALVSHLDKAPEPALLAVLEEHGTDWQGFVFDLSDLASVQPLLDGVIAQFGRVPDLLVNSAAMFGQDNWETMSAATLDTHFRLNHFAPLLLAQALVKTAGPDAQPAIVHITDQRVVNPHGDQLSYTLSKQAMAASVRTMAAAFGSHARVNAVAPGLVISTEDYSAEQEARLADMMPLGALPSPEGVAEAVLYFAQAKDVTGQTIFVDGGAHLKSFERDFLFL